MNEKIVIGARGSPLSRAQVEEVLSLIQHDCADRFWDFEVRYFATIGDLDKTTSLRTLGKTDFFTREIDQALLAGECRIAVHSAKDLPDPLPEGLVLCCLTEGLDPSDSLVFRASQTLGDLQQGARIATSSERREDAVRRLRSDLCFCDVRGTIQERLALLDQGAVDGVVVAEAALIRLRLTDRSRMLLPGTTVPGQGQLAVIARVDDLEMWALFSTIDIRSK